MNSWADLFEIAIPRALELAAEEHPALRQTLPLGFLSYMGVAHSVDEDEEHTALEKQKVAARQGFESLATGAPSVPPSPPVFSPQSVLSHRTSLLSSLTPPAPPPLIADMMALVAASLPLDVAVSAVCSLLSPVCCLRLVCFVNVLSAYPLSAYKKNFGFSVTCKHGVHEVRAQSEHSPLLLRRRIDWACASCNNVSHLQPAAIAVVVAVVAAAVAVGIAVTTAVGVR
jgi:hypothetical protein